MNRPGRPLAAVSPVPWATISLWLAVVAVIAVLPGAFDRWVIPKDLLLVVATSAGALAAARGRLPRWVVVSLVIAGLLLLVAAVTSAAPGAALWGRYPRFEGLVTIPVYFAGLWLGARLLGPGAPRSAAATLTNAVATIAAVLGIVSIVEAFGARPFPSDLARPGALLGNATDQGVVAAALVVILAQSLTRPSDPTARRWSNWAHAAALALAVATLGLSGSRAALLAAVVGIVVLWMLRAATLLRTSESVAAARTGNRRALRPGRAAAVFAATTIATVALAFALPSTRDRLTGQSPLSAQTVGDRWDIWRSATELLAQHPWGIGPSGFLDAVPATYRTGDSLGAKSVLDSPHSWLFQLALAGGWPLLGVALIAVGAGLVVGVRRWAQSQRDADPRADVLAMGLAVTVAVGVALATHYTSPGTVILPALLAGALVARPARAAVRVGFRAVVRRVAVAALAVWAVFFAVTAASELVLQQAVERVAADPVAANEMFGGAASIRPWDADLPSIAAETFAAAADASAQQEESPGAQTAESAHFAISWANRSLERTPATQGSLQARGVASQALGDLDAAAADFARVAEGNATAQQATYRWGVVEALRGNFDAAREHLEVASRLDPADAAPWSALAYVYQELGLADEADAANAKAIALEG